MPISTRQKILDYLKRNRSVSSRELARALHMTPANARHHLGVLAADGRVEVASQRRAGRGRPEKVYRLSGTLVGDNLSALADAILTEAGNQVGMEALGKRIAGEPPAPGQAADAQVSFYRGASERDALPGALGSGRRRTARGPGPMSICCGHREAPAAMSNGCSLAGYIAGWGSQANGQIGNRRERPAVLHIRVRARVGYFFYSSICTAPSRLKPKKATVTGW